MLRNYITIALRNLAKNKIYSLINVLGLALGISACILMLMFVRDELSFDQSFSNTEDVYRIQTTFTPKGRPELPLATAPVPVIAALENKFEFIDGSTWLLGMSHNIHSEKATRRVFTTFASPSLFDLFDFPMKTGDGKEILGQSRNAIISKKFADVFFGEDDPIGKVFTIGEDKSVQVKVAGVLRDPLPNTHIRTSVLISQSTLYEMSEDWEGQLSSWSNPISYAYIRLKPGTDPAPIAPELQKLVNQNAEPFRRLHTTIPTSEWNKMELMSVRDIYLRGGRWEEMRPTGDITMVYTFSALSILVLIIACINFTNLTVARASDRGREIGIRKISGAEKHQLVIQVLGENIFLSIFALALALGFVELILPTYNSIIGKQLVLNYVRDWPFVGGLFLLAVGLGFVGGLYPAFFLSSFKPISVLKGRLAGVDERLVLRSALVVVQFAISIGLIIATIIVFLQMGYARSVQLGLGDQKILTLQNVGEYNQGGVTPEFSKKIANLEGVIDVAASDSAPPDPSSGFAYVDRIIDGKRKSAFLNISYIGENFFNFYGIKIKTGRSLDPNIEKDHFPEPDKVHPETFGRVIVNEKAIKKLGFVNTDDAIGQTFRLGIKDPSFQIHLTIVGVIPDTNFGSVRARVEPAMFLLKNDLIKTLSIKLDDTNIEHTVKSIKKLWHKEFPKKNLNMHFIDESFNEIYEQEYIRGQLFAGFSLLGILIASLGLFGLSAVNAERRTLEIGLRKVMGASVGDIVRLLMWQFSRPVLLANLLAWPITYFAIKEWLDSFVYHIEPHPLAFVSAGLVTLLVALTTVSVHASRVARSRPAKALRYE